MAYSAVITDSATLTTTVRVSPLRVDLVIPSNVSVEKWFEIKAIISNPDTEKIRETRVILDKSHEIEVADEQNYLVGDIKPGETRTVIWKAEAEKPGRFIVQVNTMGEIDDGQVFASNSAFISAGFLSAMQFLQVITITTLSLLFLEFVMGSKLVAIRPRIKIKS